MHDWNEHGQGQFYSSYSPQLHVLDSGSQCTMFYQFCCLFNLLKYIFYPSVALGLPVVQEKLFAFANNSAHLYINSRLTPLLVNEGKKRKDRLGGEYVRSWSHWAGLRVLEAGWRCLYDPAELPDAVECSPPKTDRENVTSHNAKHWNVMYTVSV